MNQIIIQNNQIVLRALDKYLLKDNRFSRFYLQKQKFSKARAFRKQSDYLNNLIKTIMATTKRSFEAKVIEVKNLSTGKYLRYVNMNNGEEGIVPEWCITSFVVLPNECIDSDGHVVVGTILKLREMEDGKIYPSTSYQHRANPLQKPSAPAKAKKMSKESLYEDAQLYQSVSLDELWNMFADKLRKNELTVDAILQAMDVKSKSSEKEQSAYLGTLLGVNSVDLGKQENLHREFKSSFMHSANPLRSERSFQNQQIFKEIVAFGNSHEMGDVYVGVGNDGTIRGVEDELLNEAPFENRADFQADFMNQLSQAIDNYSFVSQIKMIWYKTIEGKLFCRISIPKWEGGIILLNGCELYVRGDAGKKQLKNADLINYVLTCYQKKVA